MPSFEIRGKQRRVRVQFKYRLKRYDRTFRTKVEALQWYAQVTQDPNPTQAPYGSTVADLLQTYADKVSPTKRGERWERFRLAMVGKTALGAVRLDKVTAADAAAWRDARIKQVSAGSVLREMILLSSAFNVARKEWGWIRENPFSEIGRPKAPPPRNRRISQSEADLIYHACGYSPDKRPATNQALAGACFRFALATAMRAGEIIGLEPTDIDGKVASVDGKTGPRKVPLTPEALAVIQQVKPLKHPTLFGLTSRQLDVMFRKATKRAKLKDIHFHDSRGEALTRLSRKVDVMTLARISGHKDLRILMDHYYRESAADIAARINQA